MLLNNKRKQEYLGTFTGVDRGFDNVAKEEKT